MNPVVGEVISPRSLLQSLELHRSDEKHNNDKKKSQVHPHNVTLSSSSSSTLPPPSSSSFYQGWNAQEEHQSYSTFFNSPEINNEPYVITDVRTTPSSPSRLKDCICMSQPNHPLHQLKSPSIPSTPPLTPSLLKTAALSSHYKEEKKKIDISQLSNENNNVSTPYPSPIMRPLPSSASPSSSSSSSIYSSSPALKVNNSHESLISDSSSSTTPIPTLTLNSRHLLPTKNGEYGGNNEEGGGSAATGESSLSPFVINSKEVECFERIMMSTHENFFNNVIQSLIQLLGSRDRCITISSIYEYGICDVVLQFDHGIISSSYSYDAGTLKHCKDFKPYFDQPNLLRIPLESQNHIYGEIKISPITLEERNLIIDGLIAKFIIKHTSYEVERRIHQSLLNMIIECTNADSMSFFNLLTNQLCKVLDATYAAVSYYYPPNRCISLSFCNKNTLIENFEYDAAGTPCEQVVNERKIISFTEKFPFQNSLTSIFPTDTWLVENHITSYLGVPIFNSKGAVIGHLFCVGESPLRPISHTTLMSISKRAASEMERIKVKQQLVLSKTVLDQFPSCVCLVNRHGIIIRVYGPMLSVFGYNESEITGKCISLFETKNPLIPIENKFLGANQLEGSNENTTLLSMLKVLCDKKINNDDGNTKTDQNHNNIDNSISAELQLLKNQPTGDEGDEEPLKLSLDVFMKELFDDDNNSLGYMVVFRDISASKAIQNSLEEANRQLSIKSQLEIQKNKELMDARDRALKAIKMKTQFTATISHEIRTPLNGLIGMTEMLLTTNLSKEQKEIAETIQRSGDILLSITSDILDFSKIEESKLELEMIEFDFIGCIENTLSTLSISCMEKPIEFLLHFDDDVPVSLIGDPIRLRQIILNVGSNAIKYTNQGHIYTHVSVLERVNGKVKIHVSIEDTGIGIPKEKRDRLFEPFSQVDASITRRYGGSGLGLAICDRIAKLMNGEMALEQSQEGKGSTFSMTGIFEDIPNTCNIVDLKNRHENALITGKEIESIAKEKEPISKENESTTITTTTPANISTTRKDLCLLVANYPLTNEIVSKNLEQIYNIEVVTIKPETLEEILYRDSQQYPKNLFNNSDQHLRMVMIIHPETTDINIWQQYAMDTALFFKDTKVKVVFVTSYAIAKKLPKNPPYIHLHKPLSIINTSKILFHQECIDEMIEQLKINQKGQEQEQQQEVPKGEGQNQQQIVKQRQVPPPKNSVPKVLVVEDNVVNQKLVSMQLNRLGYSCDVADDGIDGFEMFKKGNYKLILLDLQMPRCDGAQTSILIRSFEEVTNKPKAIIVALSATVLDCSEQYCLNVGMDSFLTKPLKLAQLQKILDQYNI